MVQQNFDSLKEAKSFVALKTPHEHVDSITIRGKTFVFYPETTEKNPCVAPSKTALLELTFDYVDLSTKSRETLGKCEESNLDQDSEEISSFHLELLEFPPKVSAFSHTSIWSIF